MKRKSSKSRVSKKGLMKMPSKKEKGSVLLSARSQSNHIEFINSLFAMSVNMGGPMTNEEMDRLIYEH
jgi:hypothetical protein